MKNKFFTGVILGMCTLVVILELIKYSRKKDLPPIKSNWHQCPEGYGKIEHECSAIIDYDKKGKLYTKNWHCYDVPLKCITSDGKEYR